MRREDKILWLYLLCPNCLKIERYKYPENESILVGRLLAKAEAIDNGWVFKSHGDTFCSELCCEEYRKRNNQPNLEKLWEQDNSRKEELKFLQDELDAADAKISFLEKELYGDPDKKIKRKRKKK